MQHTNGIYKRGGIWWYRIGRRIRKSTHSTDINEARSQRAIALKVYNSTICSDEWSEWVNAQREDSNSWMRRTFTHMKQKSKRRGWDTCMRMEEFASLILASNGKCALTGIDFARQPKPRDPLSISVDRIDCSRGYVMGNVRVVLLAVNIAMSHWGEATLMTISRALVGRELLNPLHNPLHMDKRTGDG